MLEVDREAARVLLAEEGNPDGSFLIRKSRYDLRLMKFKFNVTNYTLFSLC